jgi:hypothetical protein
MTTAMPSQRGMTSAPLNGGARLPPLSNIFGQATNPTPGSGIG